MGSNSQADELKEALAQYEAQLNQIKSAITATSSGPEHDNLVSLKSDIEELIHLTKENLQNLLGQTSNGSVQDVAEEEDPFSKEYALFKAEIEKEGNVDQLNGNDDDDHNNSDDQASAIEDIKSELASLQGSKCQAPYKHKWDEGKSSYHNALVMSVEDIEGPTSDIQDILVRVMFVNPVHKKMVPCPYYLEGDCKFTDDKCHFSHGELIPLADLKEYKEPDFSSIKTGSRVLAKHKDNLWHHANVLEIISDDIIKVKFNTTAGGVVEIDLHEVLPLDNSSNNSETSVDGACTSGVAKEKSSALSNNGSFGGNDGDNFESSSSENDSDTNDGGDEIDRESIIQLSLLRTPTSSAIGDWERHTKGIGSRLMASMGYIAGSGLGRRGDGRLEPVEAVVFPPGKSLDHCMELREAAGGDADMFKAEKRRLKIQMIEDKKREKQYEKEKQKVDVFSFINNQLSGTSSANDEENEVNKSKQLASSSRKGLNVERFRISEDIRKAEKDLVKIKESLKRHQTGSTVHKHLSNKLLFAESELNKLQASERSIAKEQNKRDSTKKLAIF